MNCTKVHRFFTYSCRTRKWSIFIQHTALNMKQNTVMSWHDMACFKFAGRLYGHLSLIAFSFFHLSWTLGTLIKKLHSKNPQQKKNATQFYPVLCIKNTRCTLCFSSSSPQFAFICVCMYVVSCGYKGWITQKFEKSIWDAVAKQVHFTSIVFSSLNCWKSFFNVTLFQVWAKATN